MTGLVGDLWPAAFNMLYAEGKAEPLGIAPSSTDCSGKAALALAQQMLQCLLSDAQKQEGCVALDVLTGSCWIWKCFPRVRKDREKGVGVHGGRTVPQLCRPGRVGGAGRTKSKAECSLGAGSGSPRGPAPGGELGCPSLAAALVSKCPQTHLQSGDDQPRLWTRTTTNR